MSREWAYDADAMREWLSENSDSSLGDLDVTDFSSVGETDATTLAERFREAFNSERELQRVNRIAAYAHLDIVAREVRRQRLASGQAVGLREAEADAPELRALSETTMRMHRKRGSFDFYDGGVLVIDPARAEDGGTLPKWDIDNPLSANVIRGVIASYPDRLYVLRGEFGPQQLAQYVYDGDIATRCNVGASPLCDPHCASERATGTRPIWGMFALTSGPHVILYSICQPCYWEFFHSERNQLSYDVFTPDIDDAEDWNRQYG